MRNPLLIFSLSITTALSAQNWQWAASTGRTYYADYGVGVSSDGKNNIYVSAVSKNVCHHCQSYYFNTLSKYDGQGKRLWIDTLPLFDAAITTNSLGETYAASGFRLIKYDPSGSAQWIKNDSTLGLNNIQVLPSGDLLAAG